MRFVALVSFVSLVSLVSFVSLCWLVRQIGRFSRGASYSRNGLLILHYVLSILKAMDENTKDTKSLSICIPLPTLEEIREAAKQHHRSINQWRNPHSHGGSSQEKQEGKA